MAIGAAIAAVASAAAAVYSADKQSKASKYAADQQRKASAEALGQQKASFNKENQKQVDLESLLEANTGSDTGTTMLTGAAGANPTENQLARGTNLLGG